MDEILATQTLIKEEQEAALRNAISLIRKYCDGRWRMFEYAARQIRSCEGDAIGEGAQAAIDRNIALCDAIIATESKLTAALLDAHKEE